MDSLLDLLTVNVPLWVATLIPAIQAVITFWSAVRRFGLFLRKANQRFTAGIRRWLGVKRQVSLTQEEYDQLAEKDANTLYIVSKKPESPKR